MVPVLRATARALALRNRAGNIACVLANLRLPRLLLPVLAAALLAGCGPLDTMKEGFAHSQAVSDRLEKSLGVKSFVGFNWNNGQLTSVSVTFDGVPANANLADIVEQSKRSVAAEFKQVPKQVVVAFTVTP